MSKRFKLSKWWGNRGGNVDHSRRGAARNRRVRLEQLETRAMLNADPVFQPYLLGGAAGQGFEGSNEPTNAIDDWTLNVDVQDNEGGTFDLAWDLNDNGIFGEPGEPTTTMTVPGDQDLHTWTQTIDWDTMVALTIADTHDYTSESYPPGPGHVFREFHVRATEGNVDFVPQTTTLQLNNTVPTFGEVTVTQDSGAGCGGTGPVTVAGSFTEYGVNDLVTVRVHWGDGDESVVPDIAASNQTLNFSVNHTYASPGFYDITYEVWDDEGTDFNANTGSEDNFEVVAGGGGGEQTVCLDDGVLTVNGSTGGDVVNISTSSGQVVVQANFPDSPFSFPAEDVQQLVVLLGDGDDTVTNGTTLPMVAVGGNGDDTLHDGGGLSILIGGDGADLLTGGGGQDILVDSGTAYDSNSTALLALLAEWNSGDLLSTRISNILNGTGVPALNSSTITDDGDFDLLLGGGGIDWILLHSGDFAPAPSDQITNL